MTDEPDTDPESGSASAGGRRRVTDGHGVSTARYPAVEHGTEAGTP
ncbi:hypothetical protein ACWFRB_05295 [Rhodococcus sp. NPDC055112]